MVTIRGTQYFYVTQFTFSDSGYCLLQHSLVKRRCRCCAQFRDEPGFYLMFDRCFSIHQDLRGRKFYGLRLQYKCLTTGSCSGSGRFITTTLGFRSRSFCTDRRTIIYRVAKSSRCYNDKVIPVRTIH